MNKAIPEYGTTAYRVWAYERMKDENRGHNYQYWSEKLDKLLTDKGWALWKFDFAKIQGMCTPSELEAKEVVKELRGKNYYARIVAGYCQNVQRIKMFSILYKKK